MTSPESVDYLRVEDLLDIAAITVPGFAIADPGLLASAVARPRATVFGDDAYPDLMAKAAALLHSLVNNHAFVDGNKRIAWVSTVVFMAMNDRDIAAPEDDAYDLVIAFADSSITALTQIAEILARWESPLLSVS